MSAPRRQPRRRIDGVVLLDKSQGLGSNSALQHVRRMFNAEKAGHTGTLDPMATGLLPLCFGEATKFSSQLLDADKHYQATVRLGIATDSGDAEGKVLLERPVISSPSAIEQALAEFRGEIEQIPPMYSALKRDGKPLYEYARAGIELVREARRVTVYHLQASDFTDDTFVMDVKCSKGTYVRSLAMDIGERLGCGAHLTSLRRIGIGRFTIDEAVTMDELSALDIPLIDRHLHPVDYLLQDMSVLILDAAETVRIGHGQRFHPAACAGIDGLVRLYGAEKDFLGLGLISDGLLMPDRLVAGGAKNIADA